MKKETETPQEQLDKTISEARATYSRTVARAKMKFKYKTATPEQAAKIIDKLLKKAETESWARGFFASDDDNRRAKVAQALMAKANIIKCHIQPVTPMYLHNLSMGREFYKIQYQLRKGISISGSSFSQRPTTEVIEANVKNIFGNIKKVELQ
jgi:hypothetical protein